MKDIKKLKLPYFILGLSFILPLKVEGASLAFEKLYLGGGYKVTGRINENDLQFMPVSQIYSAIQITVHETGRDFWNYGDNSRWCTSSKQESVKIINEILSKGVLATQHMGFADIGPYYTASVYCQIGNGAQQGGWSFSTLTPSPPNGIKCDTSVPLRVSFGNVALGSTNLTTTMPGTLRCDNNADISMSFMGYYDGAYISVGDAKVKVAFDNGKSTYKLTAQKNVTTNFMVNFQAISTGTTTGYKSGSTVLVIEWQ